jgi:hypothetical protein
MDEYLIHEGDFERPSLVDPSAAHVQATAAIWVICDVMKQS